MNKHKVKTALLKEALRKIRVKKSAKQLPTENEVDTNLKISTLTEKDTPLD